MGMVGVSVLLGMVIVACEDYHQVSYEDYMHYWRDWHEERCPKTKLFQDARISIFIRELERMRS